MSDTHPNAYRVEADAKRVQAVQLNAEADDLEAKANELDPPKKTEVPSSPRQRDANGHFVKAPETPESPAPEVPAEPTAEPPAEAK